jgi:hypothetical protein
MAPVDRLGVNFDNPDQRAWPHQPARPRRGHNAGQQGGSRLPAALPHPAARNTAVTRPPVRRAIFRPSRPCRCPASPFVALHHASSPAHRRVTNSATPCPALAYSCLVVHPVTSHRVVPPASPVGMVHVSLNMCLPVMSGFRVCARTGRMLAGRRPSRPGAVNSRREMPSHRALTFACAGTITSTQMFRCSPGVTISSAASRVSGRPGLGHSRLP